MTIGWRFDNSYSKLPDTFKEEVKPTPVNKPEIAIVNNDLAKELNLDFKLGIWRLFFFWSIFFSYNENDRNIKKEIIVIAYKFVTY